MTDATRFFEGKVALVTGGSGHIGREICRILSSQGCHLAVLDKTLAENRRFADELAAHSGRAGLFIDADLMDPSSFDTARTAIATHFGRLDFLINNAAFYDDAPGWDVPFEQEGYDAWLKVMRVNLLAPFFLVQKLVPFLRTSSSAAIVNVGTVYAMVGPDHRLYEGTTMTNPAAYCASKAGLLNLTKWLATVLAPHIRVNSVVPGGVERGQLPVFKERYHARTPLGRMASDKEVADAVAFLLSSQASYITGHNLVVDGGWTAW